MIVTSIRTSEPTGTGRRKRHVKGRTRVYTQDNKIAIGGEARIIPPAGEDG